jgi:PPOX class probable F420-dependent enzyme
MFDERALELLSKPVIARITTVGADGYPHVVPIWFMLDGDDLIAFTEPTSAKAKNARRNPKGAFSVGGDPYGTPSYTVVGEFVIEDDPDHKLTERITRHYESKERADEWLEAWKKDTFVIMRLKPRRVIRVA